MWFVFMNCTLEIVNFIINVNYFQRNTIQEQQMLILTIQNVYILNAQKKVNKYNVSQ